MRVGRKFGVRWCVASVVKWAVLAGETKRGDIANSARRKWGVWAGSLSLSLSRCSHFLHAFGLNLKGFFTHFIIVSSRFIANFSYFIVVATHLFAYERHFLGHCAFLKFLNALFLGFCALFVILSLCKRRKIHAFKAQLFAALIFYGYFATLSMTKQVSMTRTLSF